jgi:hypothetical protein
MTEVRTETARHAGKPRQMPRFRSASRHGKPAPFPRRAVLLALAVLAVAAAAGMLAMALLSVHSSPPARSQPPASHVTAVVLTASVTTCKTTDTYTYSVSSAGTVRQTWVHKYACGHEYQKWERIVSHSRTGAHYTEIEYRDERSYPRWWQDVRKWAVSKTGTRTYTHTVTSGG